MTGLEYGKTNSILKELGVPDRDLKKVSCRLDLDNAVLRIVLNDPPANVLDTEMISSLRRVVTAAPGLDSLRLVVFEGAGKHFSYGASVEEHRPEKAWGMIGNFHGLFRDMMGSNVPTAALVRGRCLGGGLELAAFCDRIVAEEGAELGQPEIRLGVFAPMGSLLLPMRCRGQGTSLLLTGRTVDTATASTIGLIDQVTPAGEGEAAVMRWATEELLPLSASSLRRARAAARWVLHRTVRIGLDELERLYFDDLMRTHDAVEGIQSFIEKRKPVWKNS